MTYEGSFITAIKLIIKLQIPLIKCTISKIHYTRLTKSVMLRTEIILVEVTLKYGLSSRPPLQCEFLLGSDDCSQNAA